MSNIATKQNVYRQFCSTIADEGIDVRFRSNIGTAYFDIRSRIVYLPTFEYLDQSMGMLLASHESGHAMFSDYSLDAFEENAKKFGDLFNIIEDGRIERLIKGKYPGLHKIFADGYKALNDNGFFNNGTPMDEAFVNSIEKFIDRLNIHLKCGSTFNVQFSPEEEPFVARAMVVGTKEECIQLCQDIADYFKEQASRKMKPNPVENEDGSDSDEEQDGLSSGSGEGSGSGESESNEGDAPEGGEEGDDSSEGNSGNGSPEDSKKNSEGSESSSAEGGEGQEHDGSADIEPDISDDMSSDTAKSLKDSLRWINNKAYKAEGDIPVLINTRRFHKEQYVTNASYIMGVIDKYFLEHKNKMEAETNFAYECAKMASNCWNRKLTASSIKKQKYKKTGTLNMQRLASYKTSQNIFKRLAIKKEEKNHGLVIAIDFSGSMESILTQALFQAAVATEFCHINGIPFEVVGFGMRHRNSDGETRVCAKIADSNHYSLEGLVNFTPDFLSKVSSWARVNGMKRFTFNTDWTPTDQAMIHAMQTVHKFKNAGIDKTIVLVITDGQYNVDLTTYDNANEHQPIDFNSIIIDGYKFHAYDFLDKRYVDTHKGNHGCYLEALIGYMKKQYGCNVIFSNIVSTYFAQEIYAHRIKAIKSKIDHGNFFDDNWIAAQMWNVPEEKLLKVGEKNYIRSMGPCNTMDDFILMSHEVLRNLKETTKIKKMASKSESANEAHLLLEKLSIIRKNLSLFATLLVEKMS